MPLVISVVVAVLIIGGILWAMRRRSGPAPGTGTVAVENADRPRPNVAEFHVAGNDAMVHFEVPLGDGEVDTVLSELLGREAIEVVREKRHTLPIGEVHRVVALGRRGADWAAVTTIDLDTPGELPPPVAPELLPHHQHDFDPFDKIADLPSQAPGLAAEKRSETLGSLEVRLPGRADAALRSQGVDPGAAGATDVALGLMRVAGQAMTETAPNTYMTQRAGQRTFIRVVPHEAGSHPELGESEIRRFVVDFGSSGAGRGLLLTEKYSPFEIYDRERRDPRMRFITRERLQAFIDALAIG